MTTQAYASTFANSGMDSAKIFPEQQSQTSPSTIIRSKIAEFARQADALANKILPPPTTFYEAPTHSCHGHYDQYHYAPYHHPHTTVIFADRNPSCDSRVSSSKGKDDNAVVLALIATTAALTALYYVGTGLSSYWNTDSEIKDTISIKEHLKTFSEMSLPKEDQLLISEAQKTASLTHSIYQRTRNSDLIGLYLKSGIVASGAISAAGFWAGSYATQYFPIPFAMLALGGLIFKSGLESTNADNLRDARALKSSIHQLHLLQQQEPQPQPQQG